MRKSAHGFRGHIPRRAGCVNYTPSINCIVIRFWGFSWNSEISNFQVTLWVKNQVLWLDVSMDDSMWVDMIQSLYQTSHHELGFILSESFFVLTQLIPQVPTWTVVHDQIKPLSVLKSRLHVHNEGRRQHAQYLPLQEDRLKALFADNFGLRHFLKGVSLMLVLLGLDLPYLAKAAFAHDVELLIEVFH